MTTIQLRRGTAAAAAADSPTLAAGEVGVELDTGRFKIGDGQTAWNVLAYATDSSRLPDAVAEAADALLTPTPGGSPARLRLARVASDRRRGRYLAATDTAPQWSLSTSSTIDGGQLTSAAPGGTVRSQDSPFRFEGTVPTSPFNTDFVAPYFAGATQPVPWRISFDFYGDAFELQLFGGGYEVQVYVDDQPILDSPADLPDDSQTYFGLVDLPQLDQYRIGMEISGGAGYGAYFGGIVAPLTYDIRPPADPNPLRMIVVGDSYSIGKGAGGLSATPAEYSIEGYVPQLSRLLGIPDLWSMGISGSGFVAAGTGTPYSGRLDDLTAADPDIVLVQGSINDIDVSGLQAAATAFLTRLIANLPAAAVLVTGPLYARSYYSDVSAVAGEVAAAATSVGLPFIDASTWATGTGRYGATNGSGTSDYYLNGDDAHPTPAGHLMLANRLAGAVASHLGLAA